MPKVSTSGMTNVVQTVFNENFDFAVGDSVVAYMSLTGTKQVNLPGPDAAAFLGNTPTPGDYYEVSDPAGVLGGGPALQVNGNGALIQGGASITIDEQYTHVRFTYVVNPVSKQAYWSVGFCACGGG
jgi:hypothetical protein